MRLSRLFKRSRGKMIPGNKDLLLKAADILENLDLPDGAKFNMNTWGKDHDESSICPAERNYCGTSACALGWLSQNPEMQDAGIKSVWHKDRGSWELQFVNAAGHAVGGFGAAIRIFGITPDQAAYLFGPRGYGAKTKRGVAARMREVAKGYNPK